jgi:hypothetical protein
MRQSPNKQRGGRNQESTQRTLTRCSMVMRPVWEDESCAKFTARTNATTSKNCKECKYSQLETK